MAEWFYTLGLVLSLVLAYTHCLHVAWHQALHLAGVTFVFQTCTCTQAF